MYEGFYHLKENPFRLTPDPTYMCMTADHREALSGLVYNVCTRPGLTVLVGEAGTGKTTLLYTMMELLEKREFLTAICNNPTLTRSEFYDLLMLKFGVSCDSPLKSRQMIALEEKLRATRADGRPTLLIIDEAQRLPVELLEEIRLLLNMETTREKLLEIILAGQPELLETLGRFEMRQLKQRVSCICRLKALSSEQVRDLLFYRLAQAGLPNQKLFPDACVERIFEYSRGIPRLVNTLSDSCLQVGFGLRSPQVTPEIVDEAARDLDLLGLPAGVESALAAYAGVALNGASRPPIVSVMPEKAKDGPRPIPAASTNGHGAEAVGQGMRVPMEGFLDQKKSMGVIAKLLDYWR